MWITLNNAFVSIVQHRDDPGRLIVRARVEGDVERFLNPLPTGVKVIADITPSADYRFRAVVPRGVVEHAMARALGRVTYPNFKDSIGAAWRKVLAMRVWSIWNGEQTRRYGDRT